MQGRLSRTDWTKVAGTVRHALFRFNPCNSYNMLEVSNEAQRQLGQLQPRLHQALSFLTPNTLTYTDPRALLTTPSKSASKSNDATLMPW